MNTIKKMGEEEQNEELHYDEMTLDNLMDAISKLHGNLSAVARAFRMSRTTIYKYVDKWKKAQDALQESRETMIDMVESSLYEQALEGNTTAMIFFLKTQGKSRGYVERQEVAGADGQAIQIVLGVNPDKL